MYKVKIKLTESELNTLNFLLDFMILLSPLDQRQVEDAMNIMEKMKVKEIKDEKK